MFISFGTYLMRVCPSITIVLLILLPGVFSQGSSPGVSDNTDTLADTPRVSPTVSAFLNQTDRPDGCYVMVRDFPTRVCQFVPSTCERRPTSIADAELCAICQRGFGVYSTMGDCVSDSEYARMLELSQGIVAPTTGQTSSGPVPPATAGTNASVEPSHMTPSDGPGHETVHDPASSSPTPLSDQALLPKGHEESVTVKEILGPRGTGKPSGPSPSPSPSPTPGPSPTPSSSTGRSKLFLGPPDNGTDKGAESNRTGCYVLSRTWPERACEFINSTCAPAQTIATSELCKICQRGFGVYSSMEECVNDVDITGAAGGIDPLTYLSPSIPRNAACDRTRSAFSSNSDCPHLQPGLRLWEDSSIWGSQGIPQQGAAVVLPENTRVLITSCSLTTNSFSSIRIPRTSELIFSDTNIQLLVGTIFVDGRLTIGAPKCRITNQITITFLRGSNIAMDAMGIMVPQGGQVDLHGALYSPTWTRLANTMTAGASWVSLQEPVNWRPGQLVAITTSIWKDEYSNQNEVFSIRSVSADGRTLVFDQPAQFQHYGGEEYQCEVALLSRNILLQSTLNSENDQKGAHLRLEGQARLQGVLAYRMGQLNVLATYPFHFHMLGNAEGNSYIHDCAVYRSYYRAVVIHGTHYLNVKDNVAFHVNGHAFYIEDGVEENNWFEHNAALFVHVLGVPASGPLQEGTTHYEDDSHIEPSDASASGFYITNSNNAFKDNTASGGFAGFFFPVLPNPLGLHRQWTNFIPHTRPLKLFKGNMAHSTGYFWQRAGGIYVGGKIWYEGGKKIYNSGRHEHNTRDNSGNPVYMVFEDTKVWLAQWAFTHWGDRVKAINYAAYDCTRGATLFGVATLQNALIDMQSKNTMSLYPGRLNDLLPLAGFQWYDTRVMTIITNTTFKNFVYQPELGPQRMSVWLSMVHSDEFKPAGISASSQIKYVNVDRRALINHEVVDTGASRYFNWVDYDGSSVYKNNPTIIGSYDPWWNLGVDCTFYPMWNVHMCDKHPWRELVRLEFQVPGYTARVDRQLAYPPLPQHHAGYVAQFGYRGAQARKMVVTRNEGTTGVSGSTGWYLHLNNGAPAEMQVQVTQLPRHTSLMFATRFPAWATFWIEREFRWDPAKTSRPMRSVDSVQAVADGDGTVYHFNGRHLYIKIVDPQDGTVDSTFSANGAIVYGTRYYSLAYRIFTNLNKCDFKDGARFCELEDREDDIPPAINTTFPSWREPTCLDIHPAGESNCFQQKEWGNCGQPWMTNNRDRDVRAAGGYCALTCGRCGGKVPGDVTGTGGASGGSGMTPSCTDTPPPGGYTCQQQKEWGKCEADFMVNGNFCAATCGRCRQSDQSGCTDVPPTSEHTCQQQKIWGKCEQSFMKSGRHCETTCGVCNPATAGCFDTPAPGGYTCQQQKDWGKCSHSFIKDNNYCALTCGFCTVAPSGAPPCEDIAPPNGFTCQQQNEWGKCSEKFMREGNYCARTCGFCTVCSDIAPPGGFSCAQQKSWGKCNDAFMREGNYCAATCGLCSSCSDVAPTGGHSCQQQKDWGKCVEAFMRDGNFCARTCGYCNPVPTVVTCTDNPPPGPATCAQQKVWGKCEESWMRGNNYCMATCGFCYTSPQAIAQIAEFESSSRVVSSQGNVSASELIKAASANSTDIIHGPEPNQVRKPPDTMSPR